MKLYIYEHCPFCSRVQYIARMLKIELEEVALNYDDIQTPTELVGKKVVPILVKDDGTAMAESGDMIAYMMDLKSSEEARQPSQQALDWQSASFDTLLKIGLPRWSQLELGEFATEESRQTWIERKQTEEMNFARLIEQTEEIVSQSNAFLTKTEQQLKFIEGRADLSLFDQALYFSMLRGYSTEPSIKWPEQLKNWLQQMSTDSGVPLLK